MDKNVHENFSFGVNFRGHLLSVFSWTFLVNFYGHFFLIGVTLSLSLLLKKSVHKKSPKMSTRIHLKDVHEN